MSLNEIELLVRRAALGRGLPFGLAEEAGAAGAWLAAAGLDRGTAIADAMDRVLDGCGGRGMACPCWGDGVGASAAVLCVGPSVVDRLSLPGFETMKIRLDVPLVLVGMIAARIEQQSEMVRLRFAAGTDDEVQVLLDSGMIMVDAPDSRALALARDALVTVTLGPGDPSTAPVAIAFTTEQLLHNRRRAIEGGLALRPEPLARLRAHAERSFVPSSAHSRERGAGAGLVDQD